MQCMSMKMNLPWANLLHKAVQLPKRCTASGGSGRTTSKNRASPIANPKGCGINGYTDGNGRITKPSQALRKQKERDIAILLPSRKANLWEIGYLQCAHAGKKILTLIREAYT